MPGCSIPLGASSPSVGAIAPVWHLSIAQFARRHTHPRCTAIFPQASKPLFVFRLHLNSARMASDRRTRALFARYVRTPVLLELKCRENRFTNTMVMPSNLRRIVWLTVAFHPTCCSSASIVLGLKAATGFIRSITSRAKNWRCGTQVTGHATGSTRAAKVDASALNMQCA